MRVFLFVCVVFSVFSCNKRTQPLPVPVVYNFETLEMVGDTLLPADTVIAQRYAAVKASSDLISCKWMVGDKTFEGQQIMFPLMQVGTCPVTLTAAKKGSMETFTMTKYIVVVGNSPGQLSPLVGNYHGFVDNNPSDTLNLTVKFWFGDRYPWWDMGAYTLNNLPRGFRDTDQNWNSYRRPEIDGMTLSIGYKNFAINERGSVPRSGLTAYGSLKRGRADTLIVNYSVVIPETWSTGNPFYTKHSYIGVKQ